MFVELFKLLFGKSGLAIVLLNELEVLFAACTANAALLLSRLRFKHEMIKGVAASLNRIFAEARGAFTLFILAVGDRSSRLGACICLDSRIAKGLPAGLR